MLQILEAGRHSFCYTLFHVFEESAHESCAYNSLIKLKNLAYESALLKKNCEEEEQIDILSSSKFLTKICNYTADTINKMAQRLKMDEFIGNSLFIKSLTRFFND